MKINHDENGNIMVVAVDSQELAPPWVSITDDQDVLMNPGKYKYVDSAIVKRRYLVITAGAQVSMTRTLTITAYTSGDAADTAATDSVDVAEISMTGSGALPGSPVTLVAGVATIDLTSSSAKTILVQAYADGVYCEPLSVIFT